jgi:hypothetical protein
MDFKVLLCPLVSSDYNMSVRSIKSCFLQERFNIPYEVHVVINSLDENFISKIKDYCFENSIKYSITESDGTAATGKNSVFDVFNQTDCTHVCQLDGDDFFYSTFLLQIQRHLYKFKTTDALASLPCDLITEFEEPHLHKLKSGYYASVWFTHYLNFKCSTFFGEDRIFEPNSPGSYARFLFFSKKVTEKFRFDSEYIVGEDRKLHFQLLHAYQKDEICYWFTTASDTCVRDTSSFGVQKKHSKSSENTDGTIVEDKQITEKLKKFIEDTMYKHRSAPGEIPIDFAPVYLSFEEKYEFLEKIVISKVSQ